MEGRRRGWARNNTHYSPTVHTLSWRDKAEATTTHGPWCSAVCVCVCVCVRLTTNTLCLGRLLMELLASYPGLPSHIFSTAAKKKAVRKGLGMRLWSYHVLLAAKLRSLSQSSQSSGGNIYTASGVGWPKPPLFLYGPGYSTA